ncbi:hypothetical protein [Sphaerisporangium fuscum]|uniref:hypothetical protein n=1 Tax=Sphaerisporangium fuscum TaxID=2835868 RepID=UPI001BDC1D5A|nr:hypothetical protein [Sphaerisporangium fuscum]
MNTAIGMVIGKLSAHRVIDSRDFPDEIARQLEPGLAVRLNCDGLSTHKAPVVHVWLLAQPCFVLHFTTMSSTASAATCDRLSRPAH